MSERLYWSKLPLMEQDILALHLEHKKSQTQVAKILGVSQPTVFYRFKRAKERLDFMAKLPVITSEEVVEVLTTLGARENDIKAMVLYVETNSQSEVARRMGTSQGAVRHWIYRALTNYLQPDMRQEDLFKRVRTACAMLVSKPGLALTTESHAKETRKFLSVNFTKTPKYRGALETGKPVVLSDTLYAGIPITVTEINEQCVRGELNLLSQKISLKWDL